MEKAHAIDGQGIIEVLIAIGIFTAVMGGVIALVYSGSGTSLDSKNAGAAIEYAAEGAAAVQTIKNRDWTLLTDGDHGLAKTGTQWDFSGTSDTRGIFTRVANIATVDVDTKKVTTTVSWQTAERSQSVFVTAELTNWQPIDTGGLSGDWTNPRTFGAVDLGPGNSATDVKVRNKIVYMTSEASAASKPDFFVIDATNPSAPSVLASINTGPTLNAVAVSGNYAYVANDTGTGQLQIIDISNPDVPSLVKTFKVTPSGDEGLSIFAEGTTVYIGLDQDDSDPEFFIVNAANPASPSVLKSIEVNASVYGITVLKGKAYLATDKDTGELTVVDVSNPSEAAIVGSYDAPGSSEKGRGVAAFNAGHIYLTRTLGGNHADHHELLIVNASNPASMQLLGSKDVVADVNDIVLVQNLAFVATSDSNAEFKIFNIANPQNITLYASYNFPQGGSGIAYENNYVYMAVRSNDALRIISSTP